MTLEAKSLSPLALERVEAIGGAGGCMKNGCEPLIINPRIESVRVPLPSDAIRAEEKDFVGYENVWQSAMLTVEFKSADDLEQATAVTFYLRNLSTGLEVTHTVSL